MPRAGMDPDSPEETGLPRVWSGTRRRQLTLLVITGVGQAVSAGAGVHALRSVLGNGNVNQFLLFSLLVAAALVTGALRMIERILTEQISQDYVHEVRIGLVRRNLTTGLGGSLGVAVARTTNDLTSVKSWVSMGIAPLTVNVPLIIGVTAVMAVLSPALAGAIAVPVVLLCGVLAVLARPAYAQSRQLRRTRGKLAGHLADAVLGSDSIRTAGGVPRELNRIERLSRDLVSAAIRRARYVGALRGTSAAAVGLITALIIETGSVSNLPTATTTAALTLVGFLAAPIHDLGRAVEYRQNYRAAKRIIGPATARRADDQPKARRERSIPYEHLTGRLSAIGLEIGDGRVLPTINAHPGDRILLELGDRAASSRLLRQLAGVGLDTPGQVLLDGHDLATTDPARTRLLVGYAAQGMLLSRGTIARAVRYRSPDSTAPPVASILDVVGLGPVVESLPKGDNTVLRHGGDPLTIPQRARLLLARALYGDPPLLVLDHIDDDLGQDGRDVLHYVLRYYRGILVIATDHPLGFIKPTHRWTPDLYHRLTAAPSR